MGTSKNSQLNFKNTPGPFKLNECTGMFWFFGEKAFNIIDIDMKAIILNPTYS